MEPTARMQARGERHGLTLRKVLFLCGILSSLLYVAMNTVGAM